MLNGIATAWQRVSANLAPVPWRIRDLYPSNWEGSNDKGQSNHFMSDLLLWMQAWSNEGETMLVNVESTDKFDINALAVICRQEEFRTNEASLYQVLHNTTANEQVQIGQQTRFRLPRVNVRPRGFFARALSPSLFTCLSLSVSVCSSVCESA